MDLTKAFNDWLGFTAKTEPISVKVYTAEELHAEVSTVAMVLMERIKQTLDIPTVTDDMEAASRKLKALGLTNSTNYKVTNQVLTEVRQLTSENIKRETTFKLIMEMYEYFGEHTILLTFEDFKTIIGKYNLVCGPLSNYTGSIPDANLSAIEHAAERLKGLEKETIYAENDFMSTRYDPMDAFATKVKLTPTNKRFPLLTRHLRELAEIREVYIDGSILDDYLDNIKNDILRFPFTLADRRDDFFVFHNTVARQIRATYKQNCKMFIAAPIDQMISSCEVNREVRTIDPLVCSYTDLGVIIHTMWGDESMDDVYTKYRELAKALNYAKK